MYKHIAIGFALSLGVCMFCVGWVGLGAGAHAIANAVTAPSTPYSDARLQARANMDRMLAEKEAAEAAAEEERDNRPRNVQGGPGSTSNEAVGVWADPLTGCQYITGGGESPVYTPRMRSTLSSMSQVCDKD